jgi:hypothetical protein
MLIPEFCINNLEWLLERSVMSNLQVFYHATKNTIPLIMDYKKNIQDCLPFGRADITGSTALSSACGKVLQLRA